MVVVSRVWRILSESRIRKFFYESKRDGLTSLTREEYFARLLADPKRAERAFEKAWAIRNFEIEMYWKRALYSWAFIASAFVAYFGLVNAVQRNAAAARSHPEIFVVVCLGFVLSLAWHLTNRGSRQWQRHWEAHVELLEDDFTGPLYKTVHLEKTYSVSKLNDLVSAAVAFAWVLLGVKYLVDVELFPFGSRFDWLVLTSAVATIATTVAMTLGYGRGRFGAREFRMFARFADSASVVRQADNSGRGVPFLSESPVQLRPVGPVRSVPQQQPK